jgi:hypothetical protein
MGDEANLRKQL